VIPVVVPPLLLLLFIPLTTAKYLGCFHLSGLIWTDPIGFHTTCVSGGSHVKTTPLLAVGVAGIVLFLLAGRTTEVSQK
jgi:hypothetical protein